MALSWERNQLKSRITRTFNQRNLPLFPIKCHQPHETKCPLSLTITQTKATSFAPRFQKLLRINQKTLHAQKANHLRVTFQNVSNDYLADSKTLKCKISEIQITLCKGAEIIPRSLRKVCHVMTALHLHVFTSVLKFVI